MLTAGDEDLPGLAQAVQLPAQPGADEPRHHQRQYRLRAYPAPSFPKGNWPIVDSLCTNKRCNAGGQPQEQPLCTLPMEGSSCKPLRRTIEGRYLATSEAVRPLCAYTTISRACGAAAEQEAPQVHSRGSMVGSGNNRDSRGQVIGGRESCGLQQARRTPVMERLAPRFSRRHERPWRPRSPGGVCGVRLPLPASPDCKWQAPAESDP